MDGEIPARPSAALQGAEVFLDLLPVIEWNRLLGQGLLHHLAVLGKRVHVRQARGVFGPRPGEVGVVGLHLAVAQFALQRGILPVAADPRGGVPLGLERLPGAWQRAARRAVLAPALLALVPLLSRG